MGVFRNAITGHVRRHGPTDQQSGRRRAGRTAALLTALALVVSGVPFLAPSTVSGANGVPARSTTLNFAGFPTWFEDANGVRVAPCLDPNDANCLAPLSGPGFDAGSPMVFPTNFPDEFFYSAVDSEPISVADCSTAPTGDVSVHLALEAAFLNGPVVPGDQMVFGRIRLRAGADSGLCASTWYTFRTPYGPVTIQTSPEGTILGAVAAANTVDIGCSPTIANGCNFDETLQAPVLSIGLLHQAPDVNGVPTAAPGYLGNGAFLPVLGGKDGYNQFEIVKWPAGVEPSTSGYQVDCTDAGCTPLGSTANFAVLAKLAGPLSSATDTLDFGGVEVGASAPKTVTLTNLGSGPLGLDATQIDHVEISGVDAAQFGLDTTTCSVADMTPTPTPLARDAQCDVSFHFAPTASAAAAFSASLDVYSAGSTVPFRVALLGTGILAGQLPGIATDPATNVEFGGVRITTASAVRTVTVTNNGLAPLLALPSITGASAARFQLTSDSCSAAYIPAGASCTVGVRYVPSAVFDDSAFLSIQTNVAGGPTLLTLNGNGTGGIATESPTNDPVNTFPDWYQDERGVRVGQCDDPFNAKCVAAPIVGDLSFPSNYPDEWFYYVANSAPIEVSDPVCEIEPGPLMVEAAAEAAFLGPIVPNGGITFGRLRIVSRGGLCPNTDYLFTHPYGQSILTTDELGDIKPAPGTVDIGCLAAPCDYHQAISSPVFEGFLEQTVRPAGWLGDPLAPSTVVGAPYLDPLTGEPANHFYVQRLDSVGQPDSVIGYTDQFTVSGRLVGPMVATPGAVTFADHEAGITSGAPQQTVTFTNTGIADVTIGDPALTIEGSHPTDFTLVGSDCAGAVLAPNASCTATVEFVPLGTGNRAGELVLHHNGKNDPLVVALSGVGLAPAGSAALSSLPQAVSFIDLHVGDTSESQTVTISNVGGQAALEVGTPSITLGAEFALVADTCVGVLVQPGETCTLLVRHVPTTAGTHTATLTVPGGTVGGAALPSLSITLTGKGVTANPAVSAASSTAGFPNWIQDRNGVRLEQCLANDGLCVLLADATFNPAQPVVFPSNYPLESFYSLVDSDLVTFGPHACPGGGTSAGGTAFLRVGTEAAFTTATPTAGGQALFNRIRIVADGLCPNNTYSFTTPYGVSQLTTDGNGEIRPKAGTFDNDAITGSDPVASAVVRWDPNVAPAAPAGFIGDPRQLHTVVGSTFVPDGATEPANYFRIDGPAGHVATTDKFFVSGRLAGPVVANLTSRDFGVVEVGQHTPATTFIFTNVGSTPVSGLSVGVSSDQFTIVAGSDTCLATAVLDTDQSCQVQVTFDPTAAAGTGTKNATLTLTHDGLRSPVSVALTGRSIPVQTPALVVSPTSVNLGSIIVNANGTASVVVRNSGTGDLEFAVSALTGTNANQFAVTNPCTSPTLLAGAQCTLTVRFTPTSRGAKAASFSISATDVTSAVGHVPVNIAPVTVSLSGTGIQGTMSPSATTLNISGRAGNVQTAKLTLTNTGNANFSVAGNPAIRFVAVSANNPVPKFSATHNCNNVIPGKNCQVTVSFTAGAGTVNEVYRVTMIINGNASNNPLSIAVNGTRSR